MVTIAGVLSAAIARAARLGEPPALVCAGRTDAGVHATGQVVHVDLPAAYRGDLAHAVNRQTAPSVVVRLAGPAPGDFDARRSATWRHYRYLVWSSPVPDPLLAGLAWHVPCELDVRTMASATDPLLGEHDFRAFCRRATGTAPDDPIVRRVTSARWRRVAPTWLADDRPGDDPFPGAADGDGPGAEDGPWRPELLRFDVVAGSFCHQMVRSVVAVLVEAGRGRASAATVMGLLGSGSRAGAPKPAPAHGLCLVGVGYGERAPEDRRGGLPVVEQGR